MCEDLACPSRGDCHHYCAVPSDHQVYIGSLRQSGEPRCSRFEPRTPIDRLLNSFEAPIDINAALARNDRAKQAENPAPLAPPTPPPPPHQKNVRPTKRTKAS